MRRRPLFALLAALAAAWTMSVGAAGAQDAAGPVEVVRVDGPLDVMAVRFLSDAIRQHAAGGSQLVVLQLDAPGVLTSEIGGLLSLVEDPPVPVAVWVGPAPAVVHGGAAQVLALAPLRAAAPGTRIGYLWPTVVGDRRPIPEAFRGRFEGVPSELLGGVVTVEGPIPGLLDERDLLPSIGQVVVGMHGRTVQVAGEERVLETARRTEGAIEPSVPVRFHEPPLTSGTLRLAIRPEAAFFFLVVGLAIVAFEFYALGPGVAGVVGLLGVLLGGYGLASLPVSGWALALTLTALVALTADVQRGGPGLLTLAGTAGVAVGGLFLTDAQPQLAPVWWAVVLTAVAVGAFYAVGIPTVVRTRFSTPTIGRRHLIGRTGVAATDLKPEGVVLVGRARWRATAHRQAGIGIGDTVEVVDVRGVVLRVEPHPEPGAPTPS